MKKNSGVLSIVGFVFLALGFLSLLLGGVGMRFSFLEWIDELGRLGAFIFKLGMLMVGFALLYVAKVDFND